MCKVYTGYCGTSQIEHGLCSCTVDNPLAKARALARGLSTVQAHKTCSISHLSSGSLLNFYCVLIIRLGLITISLIHEKLGRNQTP